MANKKCVGGILAIVLVFGASVVGCESVPQPNFYSMGDVSEESCALIQVSTIVNRNSDNGWPFVNLVKIDGQGDSKQWSRPDSFWHGAGNSIVRVPPGEHTFTITFNMTLQNALGGRNLGGQESASITYDCQAGKGYYFEFSANRSNESGLGTTTSVIAIFESDVGVEGIFGVDMNGRVYDGGAFLKPSNAREVNRETETHWMTGFF